MGNVNVYVPDDLVSMYRIEQRARIYADRLPLGEIVREVITAWLDGQEMLSVKLDAPYKVRVR